MAQKTTANESTDSETWHGLDVPHYVAEHCEVDDGNIPGIIEFDVQPGTDTNQLHRLMSNHGWRVMDTDFMNSIIYFVPDEDKQ